MKFTAAFVAAFVAMTWSQEAEAYPDYFKSQTPNYLSARNPARDQDDDLGGGSFFVEGGVNGGGQNGNPKWDGKIRYERTWDDQDEDLGGPYKRPSTFPNPMRPNRNMFDDDLGGGSFFVEGGVNGGGQNGSPKWDGKIRYERTWDEDDDALGYMAPGAGPRRVPKWQVPAKWRLPDKKVVDFRLDEDDDALGAGQTSHPWLTKLATSSLRSGPDGSCVATTLGNMDRLGIPSFSGGTTADPNNSRGAMVQMVKAGKWTSLNLSGSNLRTIKSAYGTISAYVINADSYERMAKNGQIPSGAIIFQTRHGWSVNSGASGNDMGIVRDRGRYTFNYKLMSPIIYSNAKEVVILVPK